MELLSYSNIDWIISQYWSDLIFINYRVDSEEIQRRLPKGVEVDTFNGDAYLSIVPFRMSNVRFPFFPEVPFSKLWELNIRTYVKVNGVPGVYFFTLDTNHWPAAFIAKKFFALPYRFKKLQGHNTNQYVFSSSNMSLKGETSDYISKNHFRHWICERYSLFTYKRNRIYQGVAMHAPWGLREFRLDHLEESFLREFQFHNVDFDSAFAGDPLWVRFRPFKRVNI